MFDFDVESGTIFLHDEIGPHWQGLISSKMLRDALTEFDGADLTISVNSPGGQIDEGVVLFNMLKQYPGHLTMSVDGIAASMASYLLAAADERVIQPNATVMLHAPWAGMFGNARQFRAQADVLDLYAQRMVEAYCDCTGQPAKRIREMLSGDEEHWLDAKASVDFGICDRIVGQNYKPQRASASSSRPAPAPIRTAAAAIARSPQETLRRAKATLREMDHKRREPLRKAKRALRDCDRLTAIAASLETSESWLYAN